MYPVITELKLETIEPRGDENPLDLTLTYALGGKSGGAVSREVLQKLADELAKLDIYPTTPEHDPIYTSTIDGKEFFFADYALARLIDAEVVHPLHAGEDRILTTVICNDVFAWGCADCEELPLSKIEELYRAWKADPEWGVTRWCCVRRNERPQAPIERDMRKDGAWDDAMEALPGNEYERRMREYREEKARKAADPETTGQGT